MGYFTSVMVVFGSAMSAYSADPWDGPENTDSVEVRKNDYYYERFDPDQIDFQDHFRHRNGYRHLQQPFSNSQYQIQNQTYERGDYQVLSGRNRDAFRNGLSMHHPRVCTNYEDAVVEAQLVRWAYPERLAQAEKKLASAKNAQLGAKAAFQTELTRLDSIQQAKSSEYTELVNLRDRNWGSAIRAYETKESAQLGIPALETNIDNHQSLMDNAQQRLDGAKARIAEAQEPVARLNAKIEEATKIAQEAIATNKPGIFVNRVIKPHNEDNGIQIAFVRPNNPNEFRSVEKMLEDFLAIYKEHRLKEREKDLNKTNTLMAPIIADATKAYDDASMKKKKLEDEVSNQEEKLASLVAAYKGTLEERRTLGIPKIPSAEVARNEAIADVKRYQDSNPVAPFDGAVTLATNEMNNIIADKPNLDRKYELAQFAVDVCDMHFAMRDTLRVVRENYDRWREGVDARLSAPAGEHPVASVNSGTSQASSDLSELRGTLTALQDALSAFERQALHRQIQNPQKPWLTTTIAGWNNVNQILNTQLDSHQSAVLAYASTQLVTELDLTGSPSLGPELHQASSIDPTLFDLDLCHGINYSSISNIVTPRAYEQRSTGMGIQGTEYFKDITFGQRRGVRMVSHILCSVR